MSQVSNVTSSPVAYSNQGMEATKKSNPDTATKATDAAADKGVIYEAGTNTKPATYKINKMSEADRAAVVAQMKQDLVNRQNQLSSLVSDMLSKQAGTAKLADMFTPEMLKNVSPEEIAQAKEDVSEDGYWGIKQTSQRLFDFASALAGDDPEKMKKMEEAMEKGFKQATAAWGQDLPQLTQDTMAAAHKLFEDYYASKNQVEV